MESMSEKKHLSISQLNMLSFCGEQYRRRYILGEKRPPGVSLLVGSSVDDAVSANLNNKIINKELLPIEKVLDIARDTLNHKWDEVEVALDDNDKAIGRVATRGKAVDKAVRLSELHAVRLAPSINPTHVQRKWEIELDGYPVDLLGFIDVQEGNKAIRDTKTSGKSPAKNAADTSDQLTIYAMAAYVLDGVIPERLTLDYLVDLKTPKESIIETTRTVDDFKPLLARIENACTVLEKGSFVPARQDNPLCSPKWCGYALTCRYVRKSIFAVDGE